MARGFDLGVLADGTSIGIPHLVSDARWVLTVTSNFGYICFALVNLTLHSGAQLPSKPDTVHTLLKALRKQNTWGTLAAPFNKIA